MIVLPIFDDNISPSRLTACITLDEDGYTKAYNIAYGKKTPYYYLPKLSIEEFKSEFLTEENYIFKGKDLFKTIDYSPDIFNDVNSSIWKLQEDPYNFFFDNNLSLYSRKLQELYEEEYFSHISKIKHNENIATVIKASAHLDGELTIGDEKVHKYFDHYTRGSRFHDIKGNTINIEAQNRGQIRAEGVKVYVDIDAFHLRLLDDKLGLNLMPRDVSGHDWLIQQAFGDYRPENVKQRVFQAIYSENFYLVPCDFMERVKITYKNLQSPLGRRNIPFNYKVQEYDVLEMSKIINSISTLDYSSILLYLYDGLMIDVEPARLTEFLEFVSANIPYPFKVKINEKEIRIS